MRFLVDVNIPDETVAFLNESGHDAVSVAALLSRNAPDEHILSVAIETERVIISADLDFSRLIIESGAAEPSHILLRIANRQPAIVNRVLAEHLPELEPHLATGFIGTINYRGLRPYPLSRR